MIANEWLLKYNLENIDTIKNLIEKCKYDLVDHKDRSTKGKLSKQWVFDVYGTEFNVLGNYIKKELKSLEQDFFNMNDLVCNAAWMVEGQKGSYHRLHRHTRADRELDRPHHLNLAVVIYLDVPGVDDDTGEFYFLLKKEKDVIIDSIYPKVGDIFIMPCTVWHGVYPQGPGVRRTLNIDFEHKDLHG
jgi:hypothetical protein